MGYYLSKSGTVKGRTSRIKIYQSQKGYHAVPAKSREMLKNEDKTQSSLTDVLNAYERSWVIVHMKDGRDLHLYIVDVDDEYQRNDEGPELYAIVYNTTRSNSYGNGIPFEDIDSIELSDKH